MESAIGRQITESDLKPCGQTSIMRFGASLFKKNRTKRDIKILKEIE